MTDKDPYVEDLIKANPHFEERVAAVLQRRHRMRWRLLTAWIILFTIVVVYTVHINRDQTLQNHRRIADIQQSRLISCRATYNSYTIVFRKFFPEDRKKWTDAQETSWNKLETTVTELIKQKCPNQISVKESKHGK